MLTLTIGVTYTNRTSLPRYITTCREPEPPVLEKSVNGTWIIAFDPIMLNCLGPPVVIAPGDAYRYDFKVYAARNGHFEPSLKVPDVPGTYRLRWRAFETWERLGHPPWFGRLAPVDEFISNTFRIEE